MIVWFIWRGYPRTFQRSIDDVRIMSVSDYLKKNMPPVNRVVTLETLGM